MDQVDPEAECVKNKVQSPKPEYIIRNMNSLAKALRIYPPHVLYRSVMVPVAMGMLAWKALRLPPNLFPSKRLRAYHRLWTVPMIKQYIKTFGRGVYYDQPCQLSLANAHKVKAKVDSQYSLSNSDVRNFFEYGFIPPFKVFDPKEIQKLGSRLAKLRKQKSALYNFVTDRDRHFEEQEMFRCIIEPAITERLAQLLGPNLIVWRSQIFYQKPGIRNRTNWHHATTYWFETGFSEPTLTPLDASQLFQLTVWIPTVSVDGRTGCMQFIKGSMKEPIAKVRFGGASGIHKLTFEPDFEIDPARVVSVPMEPGEVLIFSERALHSSAPVDTKQDRLAFNFRVVTPETKIYAHGWHCHPSDTTGEMFPLRNWKAVLIRGKDGAKFNRVITSNELIAELSN